MNMEIPEINGRAAEMLAVMVTDPGRPGTFYADRVGGSHSNAIQLRTRLRDLGLIEKHGDGRACTWTPTELGVQVSQGSGVDASEIVQRPEPRVEPPRADDGPTPTGRPASSRSRSRMKKAIKRRRDEVEEEILSAKIRLVELRAVKATLDDELDAMEDR